MFGDRGGIHCPPVGGRAHQVESVCCLYNRIVVLEGVQLRKVVEHEAKRYIWCACPHNLYVVD